MAVGVMSGTSADGVDAVLIELASVRRRHEPRVLASAHRPFPRKLRDDLVAVDRLDARRIAELAFELPRVYAETVRSLPRFGRAVVCGVHGQTIWHAPPPSPSACTLQIGSSAALAQHLGIPVVGDLRGADIALGGQGAPIVPFAHWFFTPARSGPRLVVNFGGICNFTYVARRVDEVLAYDVGPGMMLSDAFARRTTGGRLACDRGGSLSRSGQVVERIVDDVVAHPFVRRKPPKSTGREDFGKHFFEPLFVRHGRRRPQDVARSLLVATARILHMSVEKDARIAALEEILLSGGGAKNPVLVAEVRACFGSNVRVARSGVFAPEHHEPAAMALIAARTLVGLPSSLPQVTGATRAAILGHVHAPSTSSWKSDAGPRSRRAPRPS